MREAESETDKRKWDEQLELNKKITDENEDLRLKLRANDQALSHLNDQMKDL
jgi:hypothetical protein